MTEHDFEQLDAATEAMKSQSIPHGPSEDLVASTVEALQAHTETARPRRDTSRHSRRKTMFRFAKYGTVGTAAALVAAMVCTMLINQLPGQSAFAQVIANVQKAKTAKYRLVQKYGNSPPLDCECSFSEGIIRTEVAGQFIHLVNVKTREFVQLVPSQKVAYRGKLDGKPLDKPLSIAQAMKELTEDLGQFVETIKQDGQDLDVYDVSRLPDFMGQGTLEEGDTFRLWVDPKTQLPTRILLKQTQGDNKPGFSAELEFTNFDWSPTFKPGLFEMKTPEGYQDLEAADLPQPEK